MDPRNIGSETLATLRAEVAREHKIGLYLQYPETEAAAFLRLDPSTVKRNRRAGRVPYVSYGNGGVRFLGIMLCDYILFGERAVLLWGGSQAANADDPATMTITNTKSVTTGSGDEANRPRTTGAGPKMDAQSVLRLAQRITKRPKSA